MIKNYSIKWRIWALVGLLMLALIAVAIAGLSLATLANQNGRETYEKSMRPLQNLAKVLTLMSDNRSQIMLALQHDPANPNSGRHDFGILVDAVSGVLEIPAGDIEPPPALGAGIHTDFIAGMGKLAGRFVILLDIQRVLSTDQLAVLSGIGDGAMAGT